MAARKGSKNGTPRKTAPGAATPAMAAAAEPPRETVSEPASAPAEPVAAPEPDDKTEFEKTQERFGAAFAVMSEGMKGEGIDKAVKLVQYGLAAFAAFVVLAAIWASV